MISQSDRREMLAAIGRILWACRVKRCLTSKNIGYRAGVPREIVEMIERGEVAVKSQIERVVAAYHFHDERVEVIANYLAEVFPFGDQVVQIEVPVTRDPAPRIRNRAPKQAIRPSHGWSGR